MKKINKNHFQVIEYEKILKEEITSKYFKELEDIAKTNEFLSFTKTGDLKSQNYVGIIQTKNGCVLEILPKISKYDNYEESKNLLINMIKTLKNHPFKNLNTTNLKTQKMPLLEIFISYFLDEVDKLIKKGIKKDYVNIQDNQKFLKGKLLISKHIKKNIVHKERFFVEYDEYIENIIENRVIKTTLKILLKLSKSFNNQKRIREYLFVFDDVGEIKKHELNNINLDRTKSYYKNVIEICKIFLDNKSYTIYKGDNISFALLFDMNRLFESFVGFWFKKFLDVKLQDNKHYLLYNEKNKYFNLRPDIVYGDKIYDTKWKIIDTHSDVLNNDVYQMYAYINKYEAKEVSLIYPKINELKDKIYKFENEKELKIKFFDLDSFSKMSFEEKKSYISKIAN